MSKEPEKKPGEPGAGAERSAAEAPGSPGRGLPGRRSAEEKAEAVTALLMGKASVDQLATRFGVHPSTVEKWREEALEAIESAFRHGQALRSASSRRSTGPFNGPSRIWQSGRS